MGGAVTTWIVLAAATLISEDAACVAAGTLVARGDLTAAAGVGACAAGILSGDLGLWAMGRLGRAILAPPAWLVRRLERARAPRWRRTLRHGVSAAIVTSRFLPGTRLPLYVASGLYGVPFRTFSVWSAVAVMLWTPLVVLTSARAWDAAAAVPAVPIVRHLLLWVPGA